MLTFAEFEESLAEHLGVDAQQRDRFRARLKQLQRMSWPTGVNTGRSARPNYTATELLEVALAMELLRCGLSPDRAVRLIRTWWDWCRRAFLAARDHDHPVAIAFVQGDFTGLSALDGSGDHLGYLEDGCVVAGIDPDDRVADKDAVLRVFTRSRVVALNVTDILAGLTRGDQQGRRRKRLRLGSNGGVEGGSRRTRAIPESERKVEVASISKRTWTTAKGVSKAWVVAYCDDAGKRCTQQFTRNARAPHAPGLLRVARV